MTRRSASPRKVRSPIHGYRRTRLQRTSARGRYRISHLSRRDRSLNKLFSRSSSLKSSRSRIRKNCRRHSDPSIAMAMARSPRTSSSKVCAHAQTLAESNPRISGYTAVLGDRDKAAIQVDRILDEVDLNRSGKVDFTGE